MTFFTFLQKNIIFSQLFCTFAFTKREESEMLLTQLKEQLNNLCPILIKGSLESAGKCALALTFG